MIIGINDNWAFVCVCLLISGFMFDNMSTSVIYVLTDVTECIMDVLTTIVRGWNIGISFDNQLNEMALRHNGSTSNSIHVCAS